MYIGKIITWKWNYQLKAYILTKPIARTKNNNIIRHILELHCVFYYFIVILIERKGSINYNWRTREAEHLITNKKDSSKISCQFIHNKLLWTWDHKKFPHKGETRFREQYIQERFPNVNIYANIIIKECV